MTISLLRINLSCNRADFQSANQIYGLSVHSGLVKNYRQNENWNYAKLTKYDYSDIGIWNLETNENPVLEKLLNFIKNNLFN